MKKKIFAAGAVLLATAFVGQAASAKTLEDVLKEKGVITEEDYKEITKVKPLDYKLGKGFTLTSADEKFQLSIGGQMQIRYTLLDVDNAAFNSTAGKGDASKFELRRIKLLLNGYAFTKDLAYKVTYNFVNNRLEETYLNYRVIDEFQIRPGQDKVQFSRQWITPSSLNEFVDVSPVTNAFYAGYDTGVSLNGKIAGGLAYYWLGGYGGAGQTTYRNARDNAFAARIAVNPLGDMPYSEGDVDYSKKPLASVGSSFYSNTVNSVTSGTTVSLETNNLGFTGSGTGWFDLAKTAAAANPSRPFPGAINEKISFTTAEVDAAFKWLGFFAQAEYFMAQADGKTSNRIARGQGWYGQAGYFIIPTKLEIAARYSYLDPNRDVANDHWVETTGAVSYYFNKHNLKIQADYSNIHKQGRIASAGAPTIGADQLRTDDKQVRLQAQLLF